jgi:L-iditol 2-dehydrogenase
MPALPAPNTTGVRTMSALVLHEPRSLAMCEAPVPEPGPGEVLVRVVAATTCGTDLKAYLRGHPQIPMPGVLGHEYSGVVEAAGEGAAFAPGQAVMGVHSAPCRRCFWCARDQENLCERVMQTKVLGSFAQFLLVPRHIAGLNVFEKPAGVSFARACLLEPLSCVSEALGQVALSPDLRVLVLGPGAFGLMFVAALGELGTRDVTVAGRNRARLNVATSMGARALNLRDVPRTLGRGYDLVVECTGAVEVWERSVDFVRRGGTVVLFGGCPAGTAASFQTSRIHYDQIRLLSPFHFGTRAVRQARDWILANGDWLDPLLTAERPLEDAPEVFASLEAGQGLKYVLLP